MSQKVDVATADYALGRAPQILTTEGIGSCVAICLYHQPRQIGALLHVMLPRAEGGDLNPLRFADTALSLVLVELTKQGITKTELIAKLIGGAQMFKSAAFSSNIGARNAAEVRLLLSALGIAIAGEDLGGTTGRSLEFDLATGLVHVSTRPPH